MEIILPVDEGLETVHHRTVETIGGRHENDGREEEVELSKTRFLPPSNLWKLASTKDVTLVGRWRSHSRHDGRCMFCCEDAGEDLFTESG